MVKVWRTENSKIIGPFWRLYYDEQSGLYIWDLLLTARIFGSLFIAEKHKDWGLEFGSFFRDGWKGWKRITNFTENSAKGWKPSSNTENRNRWFYLLQTSFAVLHDQNKHLGVQFFLERHELHDIRVGERPQHFRFPLTNMFSIRYFRRKWFPSAPLQTFVHIRSGSATDLTWQWPNEVFVPRSSLLFNWFMILEMYNGFKNLKIRPSKNTSLINS